VSEAGQVSPAIATVARGTPLAMTYVLCALVMVIDGYDLAAMPLAVPHVAHAWRIPPQNFGWSLSAVLVGLGLGAILLGSLGDRYGRRPAVLIATAAIALATAATATAGSVTDVRCESLNTRLFTSRPCRCRRPS